MIKIKQFVFNSFQENTYVLYNETGECIIVDPGCYEDFEKTQLQDFIKNNKLKPVKLINTHSHVDHILGNNFVINNYGINLTIHKEGLGFHKSARDHAMVFGLVLEKQIDPKDFVEEGDEISFGNSKLQVLYTPGHVDGHICLLSREQKFVIAGDVLFQMSIGRTDLPTGSFDLLIKNIREKLMTLSDDFVVYTGHGPETTIGFERKNNPFLN